ncbi:hypothetical protein RV07_GL003956 [Enterococcus malodoratus]|nr:hypothetical protein RV07_GL003956 [Enterococcus malodoratus]
MIAFFYFIFNDMTKINTLNLPKRTYVLNYSLLMIVVVCIILAVYLYFDVQKQVNLLEKMV